MAGPADPHYRLVDAVTAILGGIELDLGEVLAEVRQLQVAPADAGDLAALSGRVVELRGQVAALREALAARAP